MAGWIKMPLGMETGFVPGDIVLDGDPAPPKRGTLPILAHMLWPNGWMDQDATWYGYGHIVLDGDSAHPERGTTPPFSARVHVL